MLGGLLLGAALVLASPPSHVMDQAGIFGEASKADLERRLVDFENQHKIEIVVATFESLMGRPENQASLQLTRDWALGSRTSKRAVLIAYWKTDKVVRIDMTDALPQFSGAKAAEIVDRKMIPLFKERRSVLALEAGANEVMAFLGANPWSATPIVKRTSGNNATGKALGGAGSVALVIVFLVLRVGLSSAGIGGRGYRRGWGLGSSSWGGSSWGRSSGSSSWGGSSRSSGGGGGGFSGRGASGRW